MVQGNLFDDASAQPIMEPGDEWYDLASKVVYALAQRHLTFTPNEVWAAMPVRTPINRRRAMGPVMNRAVKSGWIDRTEQFVATGSHGRPVPIYRSRIIAARSNVASGSVADKSAAV